MIFQYLILRLLFAKQFYILKNVKVLSTNWVIFLVIKKVKEDINFSLKKLIRFFNTKIFHFLNNRFYKKKNIYLCAGKIKQKEYKNLKFIKTHSFDYNEKIKCKKKLINKKKFFLYLDQYEHDHPDYNYNEVRKINAKRFL